MLIIHQNKKSKEMLNTQADTSVFLTKLFAINKNIIQAIDYSFYVLKKQVHTCHFSTRVYSGIQNGLTI